MNFIITASFGLEKLKEKLPKSGPTSIVPFSIAGNNYKNIQGKKKKKNPLTEIPGRNQTIPRFIIGDLLTGFLTNRWT